MSAPVWTAKELRGEGIEKERSFLMLGAMSLAELLDVHRGSIDRLKEWLRAEAAAGDVNVNRKASAAKQLFHKAFQSGAGAGGDGGNAFEDDVFLLRHVARYQPMPKKFDKATESVAKTIVWRFEKRERLEAICASYFENKPKFIEQETYERFMIGDVHGRCADGSILFIDRIALHNPKGYLKAVEGRFKSSKEAERNIIDGVVEYMEPFYRLANKESRATNRLVRMVSIEDMTGSQSANSDTKMMGLMGKAMDDLEVYYPSMQKQVVMLNMPSVMQAVIKVAMAFFPKTMKMTMRLHRGAFADLHIPAIAAAGPIVDMAKVPTFLGGKCACNGGCCIAGVPNGWGKMFTGSETPADFAAFIAANPDATGAPTAEVLNDAASPTSNADIFEE